MTAQDPTPTASVTISPHEEALLEAGKNMVLDSLNVGREFCKFMVGTSTAAVPAYLAVLRWFLPEQFDLTENEKLLAVAPVVAFMVAALIFALGYKPTTGTFSVDMFTQIEMQRSESITRRAGAIFWGFIIFAIGVINGAVVTIYLDPAVPPQPSFL